MKCTLNLNVSLATLLLVGMVLATTSSLAQAEVPKKKDLAPFVKQMPLTRVSKDCSNLPNKLKRYAISKGYCDPSAPKPDGSNPVPTIGDCGLSFTFVDYVGNPGYVNVAAQANSSYGAILSITYNIAINNFYDGYSTSITDSVFPNVVDFYKTYPNVYTGYGTVTAETTALFAVTDQGYACYASGSHDEVNVD
jgi:hypothetical protein